MIMTSNTSEPDLFTIEVLSELSDELKNLRQQVFIDEQAVPEAMEWDEFDEPKAALHFQLAINQTGHSNSDHRTVIGGARLTPSGQIGRVLISPNYRRQGYAKHLLKAVINYNQTHQKLPLMLHAQINAKHLYASLGFVEQGQEFLEAGIVHITMIWMGATSGKAI